MAAGIIVLYLCLISLILYGFLSTIKPKKYPPGPAWFPFIGSATILQKMIRKHGSEYKAVLELSRQYSTNVLGLKTSAELIVVVFGEKNVRQVFHGSEFDARPHNYFAQLRCLGYKNMGITFANGEIWKEHRQYAIKTLKSLGLGKAVMEKQIQHELSMLLEYIKDNEDQPINMAIPLAEAVTNVLWTFVAGERIPKDKLQRLMSLFERRAAAFSIGGGLLNQVPWSRYIIPEASGYTLINTLNQEILEIIEETIERHKKKEVHQNDFISLFLQKISSNSSPTFTEEQLKIVCLDLLIAVSQTSSNYLGFALLRALKCQEVQQKIYDEINAVIGDETPCWQDSERLVYTTAYIQEISRYYVTLPMAGPRLVLKDTCIDGYIIPEGTSVLISLGDIYSDPELWKDPHLFRPERFIDETGRLKKSEHMYTFGQGRRRCPGDFLAKPFIFITLVGILQKYRMQCSGDAVPSEEPVIGIFASPKPYTIEFIARKKDI